MEIAHKLPQCDYTNFTKYFFFRNKHRTVRLSIGVLKLMNHSVCEILQHRSLSLLAGRKHSLNELSISRETLLVYIYAT